MFLVGNPIFILLSYPLVCNFYIFHLLEKKSAIIYINFYKILLFLIFDLFHSIFILFFKPFVYTQCIFLPVFMHSNFYLIL